MSKLVISTKSSDNNVNKLLVKPKKFPTKAMKSEEAESHKQRGKQEETKATRAEFYDDNNVTWSSLMLSKYK